ncbi:UspA domain protein [Denitrovibrio acetiphilus DSM 12809]|uniref:Universal stress protein n=1 Tax=Denitrovibrio acetiphilus (strain DSM 12809 / NBRC 114555 / N2460) TaxID=522772 RepID=D4H8G9_DENA2|nr:universal stress protein [Denitrovibrio acetiphilus]ADD68318.1 UspA domain protein [Denitrovibrio acetiphilus DSM 12809]
MSYKHILSLTDFSEYSKKAVEEAATIARCQGSKLTIMHVAHDQSQFQLYINENQYKDIKKKIDVEIEEKFSKLEEEIPVLKELEWESYVRRGTPYIESLYEMENGNYDLVVLGSHGEGGFKRIVHGSTAGKILRHSPISVLITKI